MVTAGHPITHVTLPTAATVGAPGEGAEVRQDTTQLSVLNALAVDEPRHRLYAVTSSGDTFDSLNGTADPAGPVILAYETPVSATSKPLWSYRVRSCPAVLNQSTKEGYLDVGSDGTYVYLPCRGVGAGVQYVMQGVVRVDLRPADGADKTAGFVSEFFPFAGPSGGAFAVGDPTNDRVGVAVSGLDSHRVYVFDAEHRSWVGSMLLGKGAAAAGGAFSDPTTGRLYASADGRGLWFIEPDVFPARVLTKAIAYGFAGVLPSSAMDPDTRTVAVPPPTGFRGYDVGEGVFVKNHLWLYEDRTPVYQRLTEKDPDVETHDIPESEAYSVTHGASASAYGARAVIVGGIDSTGQTEGTNRLLGQHDETGWMRLEAGNRGLFLSHVSEAQLTGQTDSGQAVASAAGMTLDKATAADLQGKYSYLVGLISFGDDTATCDPSKPDGSCLTFDSVSGNVGELQESTCGDFGNSDDERTDEAKGSSVSCARVEKVTAQATGSSSMPTQAGPMGIGIGFSDSRVEVVKDPAGGVVTVASSVARGVTATMPGVGTLTIGEISSKATSKAAGRPGTAKSTLETVAKNVRISDAAGAVVFDCGVPNVDAPAGDPCSTANVAAAVNRYLAPRIVARGPRQDLNPGMLNSPGGARAVVVKEPFAYWNDATVNSDSQREVTALDLTVYLDGDTPSRLNLQLAAVYSEAQYQIGETRAAEVVGPTKLGISLIDGDAQPLAGGAFQVREAGDGALPGRVVAACVTTDDGVGTCSFEDLPPGEYVVSETVAPPGYALADDAPVLLAPDERTDVAFTNLRNVGAIAIALADEDGSPLAGGTFELFADDGDLVRGAGDEVVTSCTTTADGRCGFDDVPLAGYVVHPASMPSGYLVPDDAAFALSQPGQVADLAFTTGLEGIAGAGEETEVPPSELDEAADTAVVGGPTDSTEVVVLDPAPQPIAQVTTAPLRRGGLLRRLAQLPSDVASFLRRKPGEAVLFALVWMLLGSPLYLATRRRSLALAKVAL
jgi:hypothetical protein